jgi:hypothetical protein
MVEEELIMYTRKIVQLILFSSLLFCGWVSQAIAEDDGGGKKYSESDVKGRYGFSFSGEIIGVGPIAAVGYIVADGKGNIPEAERTMVVLGTATTQSFSCTYTMQPSGMGHSECMIDDAPAGTPLEAFDVIMEENGKAFRLVGTTPGLVIIGAGHR